jgi:long-chain acyl-CoA synthetase
MGEVVIVGHQVVDGYWENPVESAVAIIDDQLHTGDIGFLDKGGWLYLVDRSKDLIVTSGYKVWPREVEDVIIQHPDVSEVAVVGGFDDYRGEKVLAFVSLKPGATASERDIIEFCRERIAVFKSPRSVEFLPSLPKTASGKILRRALRKT